jgi:hypothetical protein
MGRRRMHIEYWWEIQKERDSWEDQDVNGVDWIDVAEDRYQWSTL